MMSMYSELLSEALRAAPKPAVPDGEPEEGVLVHRLWECRHRLGARFGPGDRMRAPADAPVDIAREIDYDLILIRLCRCFGIACGPSGFTRPFHERRRLEQALSTAGVDVGERE